MQQSGQTYVSAHHCLPCRSVDVLSHRDGSLLARCFVEPQTLQVQLASSMFRSAALLAALLVSGLLRRAAADAAGVYWAAWLDAPCTLSMRCYLLSCPWLPMKYDPR